MKHLLIVLFCLFGTVCLHAQDSLSQSRDFSDQHLTSGEPEIYVFDNVEYTFTPNGLGFTITRIENGQEITYGQLHQTTDDGYFMLSTADEEEAAFGRFDEEGNFRALRFDQESDTVIEEHFEIQNPVERRNQQRISRDTINQ